MHSNKKQAQNFAQIVGAIKSAIFGSPFASSNRCYCFAAKKCATVYLMDIIGAILQVFL
jgi:hypothetical protein